MITTPTVVPIEHLRFFSSIVFGAAPEFALMHSRQEQAQDHDPGPAQNSERCVPVHYLPVLLITKSLPML